MARFARSQLKCAHGSFYDPNNLPPGILRRRVAANQGWIMTKRSAGLLMFRRRAEILEVFLVHPGGPFWAKKDLGAWSIPKGEYSNGEDALTTARREFEEETGIRPKGKLVPLADIKQRSGKLVKVWAFEGDYDPSKLHSNTFTMEWPNKSGMMREFPEIDRGAWFPIEVARTKLLVGQIGFLDQLASKLGMSTNS